MAVLKINNKWYSLDKETVPETTISLKYSYIQKEKNLLFGYVVHNEIIYPLIGYSQNSKDSAVLIKIKNNYLAIIVDDINFDEKTSAEPLIELLRKDVNV